MKDFKKLVEVAMGREPADLVLKNAQVVNVFTGEIVPGEVAISGGYIAAVGAPGNYSGHTEADCAGGWLCPGFVDAHIHIESTMVLPGELVKLALPSGTTTIIADPHEIVNVCGEAGMRFMLDAGENLPCNLYYMLPSCVPSTPFETAGGCFTAQQMRGFMDDARVLGLGEAMSFNEVVNGRGDIIEKLAMFQGRMVDGHAPGLTGKGAQAYAAAGVRTEHESTTYAEAMEKARAGMAILVREGSAAHNLTAIIGGILDNKTPTDRFMFCTDDKHLDDLGRDGHIRWNIHLAVQLGMDPVEAIRLGSWNAAVVYGLKDIGAVAPGFKADLVLLSNLRQVEVARVYKDGVPAAERIAEIKPVRVEDKAILDSVKAKKVRPKDFALAVNGPTDVIGMVPYQLVTQHLVEEVPSENGLFVPSAIYTKLCVVERHGQNGNIAVAPLKGYGIVGGALATTVAHDSHNIIAAGDNDEDLALAVNRLRETGGGYVLVQRGRIVGEVPLVVAGLMSTAPAEEVQEATGRIIKTATSMGIPYYIDPFISLSFMALPVIPALRLTDKGLFDAEAFRLIGKVNI